MIADELGQRLHDRATRGERLSDSESAQLHEWYSHHDRQEQALLNGNVDDGRRRQLHHDISAGLARLVTVSKEIQALAVENESLRSEISSLHEQLIKSSANQPA